MSKSQPSPDPAEKREILEVIGNPFTSSKPPVRRKATLADIEDDCAICQQMREKILAGNPPTILFYEE